MGRGKTIIEKIEKKLEDRALEGIYQAADFLAQRMQVVVGIQGGGDTSKTLFPWEKAQHEKDRAIAFDKKASREGQPPFRRTGVGQASIGWAPIQRGKRKGAIIGARDIGIPGMIGGSYMAGWDSPAGIKSVRGVAHHHKWLSHPSFGYRRYIGEIRRIIRKAITRGGK